MDRDPHGYVVHRLVSRHKPHKLQITRVGVASRGFKSAFSDLYHVLLDFTWWKLLVGVSVLYLGMNLLFALLFYWDTQGIVNMVNHSGVAGYRDCFFFSVQTWETIGFGLWSPLSPYVNAVATVEAYFSTLFTAVLTGCVFAKISRPSRIAREFVFSDVAVVSFKQTYFQAARANGRSELESQHQTMITSESSSTSALHSLQGTTKVTRPSYEEYPRLVLRVCSMRKSQLCVPEFTLLLLQKETPDGREPGLSDSRHVFRMHQLKFDINDQLGLGTNISPHLPLPWTIVHLMNRDSPLYNATPQSLEQRGAEIVAILEGVDEACSGVVQCRWSYLAQEHEIVWNATFSDMVTQRGNGYCVDFSLLSKCTAE